MATLEEWARRPAGDRRARLARTPGEIAAAIAGRDGGGLVRRPDATNWSATEVVCHLRDTEESFLDRLRQIVLMDEPVFVTTNPDRWAAEREYGRQDAAAALAAFGRRRAETLAFLDGLRPEDWRRAGRHTDSRGRRSIDDFVGVMAWPDENHVDQLRRALEGRA